MGTLRQPIHAIVVAMLTLCFILVVKAQQPSLPSLSPVVRTTLYPEVMCVHCVVPTWDQHYLLHLEIDKDPTLVTMYDRDGKKVLEGRVSLPGAVKISLRAVGATQGGAIVAVGGAAMTDGSVQHFIAEIGSTGRTLQSIQSGQFSSQQVCAAPDGTVWTLGYDQSSQNSTEADKNVLRHYSFAKGLLGSFVSLDSVSQSRDAVLLIHSQRKGFLRCGKESVSLLFWSAAQSVAQYIVLNTSTGKLDCWKIIAPFIEARANGFALTHDGGAFVSLSGFKDSENILRHGLYKLEATTGSSIATLIPVAGTVTTYTCQDCNNWALPDGTFVEVYGADGDELVVQRIGDGWGLSWAKVSPSVSSPD